MGNWRGYQKISSIFGLVAVAFSLHLPASIAAPILRPECHECDEADTMTEQTSPSEATLAHSAECCSAGNCEMSCPLCITQYLLPKNSWHSILNSSFIIRKDKNFYLQNFPEEFFRPPLFRT